MQGSHSSRFSQEIPGFTGFKQVCAVVPGNSVGTSSVPDFTGHKSRKFLTMTRNILPFPQWEKASVGLTFWRRNCCFNFSTHCI